MCVRVCACVYERRRETSNTRFNLIFSPTHASSLSHARSISLSHARSPSLCPSLSLKLSRPLALSCSL